MPIYQQFFCRDGFGNIVSCGPACGEVHAECDETLGRNYSWGKFSCVKSDDEIRGCNPLSTCRCTDPTDPAGCPRDTGNFYIKISEYPILDLDGFFIDYAPNCEGDFLEVGCSLGGMGMRATSPAPKAEPPKPTTAPPRPTGTKKPCGCGEKVRPLPPRKPITR